MFPQISQDESRSLSDNSTWGIRRMLSNEKYKGDALLQKTYIVDFLTKKRVENNGGVPQSYIEKCSKGCPNKHIDYSVLYQAFINTFKGMIENKDYFMAKWKEDLKSDNLIQTYKSKQFMRIVENAEPKEELDMDLFFRIIEKMIVFEGRRLLQPCFILLMLKLLFNKIIKYNKTFQKSIL